MTQDKLSELSMDFAVEIIALVKMLKERRENVISNQIGRSGTSIGANIREAKYAHGIADFISKMQIALKEANETGYSPNSVIEFYDDRFVETTEENRTEQKYTSIERISVVDNKMLYIHVNNIMAYTLPLCSFESEEQYNEFLEFMKAKCSNVDIYC